MALLMTVLRRKSSINSNFNNIAINVLQLANKTRKLSVTNLWQSHRQILCTCVLKNNAYWRGITPRTKSTLIVSRCFHTSGRKNFVPPVVWFVMKPAAKLVTILSGRLLRKHYRGLTPEKQLKFRNKYSGLLGMSIIILCIALVLNYNYHLHATPITNRQRYIAFNNDQIMKLVTAESTTILETLKPYILPASHPGYKQVARIVNKILVANQDLEFFKEQNWTIVIVNSEDINAAVLPTGHIFVYTGLLELAQSDDQLAVVLGHEMSHALLQHGAEKIAIAQFFDYFIILFMAAIWAVMPNDGIAFVTNWFYHKVVDMLVSLPYSRKLEMEADHVGMKLIAKACYDVREASTFWVIMHVQSQLAKDEEHFELPEYFSTHPSHENRAFTLDQMIEDASQIRQSCNCGPLPKEDPRSYALWLLDWYHKEKEKNTSANM